MFHRALTLIVGALTSIVGVAQPTDKDIAEEINNNVSHEYVTCAAYFIIVGGALTKDGAGDLAAKYDRLSNSAIELALVVARQDRSQEMAEKVTLARLKTSSQQMFASIDRSYSNISILTSEHAERCKDAMENPDKLMNQWATKVLEKRFSK